MDERYYDEFDNKYYNPDDDDAKPGDNLNWKKIQRGFKRVEDKTEEDYGALNDKLNDAVTDLENTITDNVELLNRNKASVIITSISGSVATFPDGADNVPVKLLVVDIKPVQSGTGDPSPDNVRPINGWTQANITRAKDDINDQFDVVYPIIFPTEAGTVYGGTLDVTNGVLTVDAAILTFTGEEGWLRTSSGAKTFFRCKIGNVGEVFGYARPYRICSCYNKVTVSNTTYVGYDFVQSSAYDGDYIYIRPDNVYDAETDVNMTLEEFKQILANLYNNGTPCQIVYQIKTPVTYQLTLTEVRTLLGENNIFADTGDIVNLEYRADTKLYIDRLTAPDSDMIADANITSGSYFMVNNSLYIATAAIAAGETIVPGTNCTLTNLAAALNALNA